MTHLSKTHSAVYRLLTRCKNLLISLRRRNFPACDVAFQTDRFAFRAQIEGNTAYIRAIKTACPTPLQAKASRVNLHGECHEAFFTPFRATSRNQPDHRPRAPAPRKDYAGPDRSDRCLAPWRYRHLKKLCCPEGQDCAAVRESRAAVFFRHHYSSPRPAYAVWPFQRTRPFNLFDELRAPGREDGRPFGRSSKLVRATLRSPVRRSCPDI